MFAAACTSGASETEAIAQQPSGSATGAYEELASRKDEIANAFAAQAAYCSSRQDTAHYAFHGCIDWHSAAHAAWALTAYEAMTGQNKYAAQIAADLTPENITAEVAQLRDHPGFEMPYGRAWFLRLAVEWKAQHPGDDRLDDLADVAAQSLRDHYASFPPEPTADRYGNPSWALINLLHYARANDDPELEAFVEAQVRENFLAAQCPLERESVGFIAVCTTWAWLVSEVLPSEEFDAWYADWNPGLETLTPVTSYPSAHDYGRNFSRAWGLYHLAQKTNDPGLRDLYARHVLAGFEPDSRWRGDYGANGHWVAQFGMLAIEPLFDEE